MKKIYSYLNMIRTVWFYLIIRKSKEWNKIKEDMGRAVEYGKPAGIDVRKSGMFMQFNFLVSLDMPFRNIIGYRIKNVNRLAFAVYRILIPQKKDLEIQGNIDGGLQISHGHGTVILVDTAGKNLSVWQGVTIGKNRGGVPTIGDNVKIYTNAVVGGDIQIGDDVVIAAGSVVLQNVPENSLVYGNPCVIKERNR